MPILPSGARVLQGDDASGELADLAWALDTDDATKIETFPHSLAPGAMIARHAHSGPLAARVTAGRMTFAFGVDAVELTVGDVIGLPVGLAHVETVPVEGGCHLLVAHVGPFETYDA